MNYCQKVSSFLFMSVISLSLFSCKKKSAESNVNYHDDLGVDIYSTNKPNTPAAVNHVGACITSVVMAAGKGQLTKPLATKACYAIFSETGPVLGFACGQVIGAAIDKISVGQLQNLTCAQLSKNRCVEIACDPVGMALKELKRLADLNGRHYTHFCVGDELNQQWLDFENGKIVGSGSVVCGKNRNSNPDKTPESYPTKGPFKPTASAIDAEDTGETVIEDGETTLRLK